MLSPPGRVGLGAIAVRIESGPGLRDRAAVQVGVEAEVDDDRLLGVRDQVALPVRVEIVSQQLLTEEFEGWAAADLKDRGDGGEPTVTTAAWKRVCKEKERELAALVGEGVLEGVGKGKRLLINAGSFYGRRGEEAPVWPDWGLAFAILPDAEAKEVDRRRRARERAREALMQGPSFAALLGRGSGGDSGGGGDAESKVAGIVSIHGERLREGAQELWQSLVAGETVVEEMEERFGGEDPLKPATRQALRHARMRLDELIEHLKERLGPLELGKPPDQLLNTLRRSAGLRAGR